VFVTLIVLTGVRRPMSKGTQIALCSSIALASDADTTSLRLVTVRSPQVGIARGVGVAPISAPAVVMATDAAVVTTVVASSEMASSSKMASASSASGQCHRRNCCGTTQKHGGQDHRHRFSTYQSPPSQFFRSIKIDQLFPYVVTRVRLARRWRRSTGRSRTDLSNAAGAIVDYVGILSLSFSSRATWVFPRFWS
jgi:hypothetical protein